MYEKGCETRCSDGTHFKRILQDSSNSCYVSAIKYNVEVSNCVSTFFVNHQVPRSSKSLPVDVLERVPGNVLSKRVKLRALSRCSQGGGAGVHFWRSASKKRFFDVLDLREDDDVAVMVDVHVFNAQIEGVSRTQRNGSNGVVAPKRAPEDVAYACAFPRLQVELHLVQAASQLHFMWNVVVDVQHLRFPVASVGDQEFNVKVVALVEVVSRERALDFDITMAGYPGIDDDERDERQTEDHHLLIGNHHADKHQSDTAGERKGGFACPHDFTSLAPPRLDAFHQRNSLFQCVLVSCLYGKFGKHGVVDHRQ